MIEEEHMEAERLSELYACKVCGFKADTLGCPRCAERKEELREREACGYEGEAPYFRHFNQPFTPEEIAILKRLAKEEDKHE